MLTFVYNSQEWPSSREASLQSGFWRGMVCIQASTQHQSCFMHHPTALTVHTRLTLQC